MYRYRAEYGALAGRIQAAVVNAEPAVLERLRGEVTEMLGAADAEMVVLTREYDALQQNTIAMLNRLDAAMTATLGPVEQQLSDFRVWHNDLEDRIHVATGAQQDDWNINVEELNGLRSELLEFINKTEERNVAFPEEEHDNIYLNVNDMLENIDVALGVYDDNDGQNPRRIEFNRDFLAFALDTRTTAEIGRIFGCSAQTVRRRAIDYGLWDTAW